MKSSDLRRADIMALAAILTLAAVLRGVGLDAPLWYDEILTLTDAVRRPFAELMSGHASFNNHPLYTLQAQGVIALLGESYWALRLPAFVFGILSIAAMWRLAYGITDARRAHVTALFITLSYHHVWYSQNARAYTELMFWFAAASIVLIRAVSTASMRTWVFYGLLVAAGAYTHLTAATFFASQAIVVGAILIARSLPGRRQSAPADAPTLRWSMPVVGFGLGGLLTLALYAPSIAPMVQNIMAVPTTSAVDVMVEYQSPIWTALEMIRTVASPGPLVLVVALGFIVVVGIGIRETARVEPTLPAVVAIHIPLTLALLLVASMRIWPRFFFADMGFVLLFMTEGLFACSTFGSGVLKKIGGPDVSARALFAAASTVLLLASGGLVLRNYSAPKQDFDGALAYVRAERAEGDVVVTLGLASVPYTDYFETGWPTVETEVELRSLESVRGRTWLVLAFPSRTTRKYTDVMERVESEYSLAREFPGTLGDGDVLVYVSEDRAER